MMVSHGSSTSWGISYNYCKEIDGTVISQAMMLHLNHAKMYSEIPFVQCCIGVRASLINWDPRVHPCMMQMQQHGGHGHRFSLVDNYPTSASHCHTRSWCKHRFGGIWTGHRFCFAGYTLMMHSIIMSPIWKIDCTLMMQASAWWHLSWPWCFLAKEVPCPARMHWHLLVKLIVRSWCKHRLGGICTGHGVSLLRKYSTLSSSNHWHLLVNCTLCSPDEQTQCPVIGSCAMHQIERTWSFWCFPSVC